MFGEAPREPDPPDGYARIHLGRRAEERDADRRLREMAEREVERPRWQTYPPEVRKAYVRLYGRRRGPGKDERLGWAETAAVKAAMGMRHDVEAEERAAIEGEDRAA